MVSVAVANEHESKVAVNR